MLQRLALICVVVVASGCHKNLKQVTKAYARELNCPADNVIALDFPKDDKMNGEAYLVYGCDQRRVCFDDNTKGEWACRYSDALQQAIGRLKLETNCPQESIRPLAYFENGRAPTISDWGSEWDWQGGAYRLDVCGKNFVCNVNKNGSACAQAQDLSKTTLQNGAPPAPATPARRR